MLKDIPYVKKTAVEMKLYFASQMRSLLMICALEEGRQTCRDNKSMTYINMQCCYGHIDPSQ